MKTYAEMQYHPTSEQLVKILMESTQNANPLFFRVMVAYYFAVVASMMRCKIKTQRKIPIPVNLYAINLATSGAGKGHATNILEEEVIDQFRINFEEITLPMQAAVSIPKLALNRSIKKASDPDMELKLVEAEYNAVGPMYFCFDSGTAPAIKDVRHKLLISQAGALNLQVDEIGTNLSGIMDILGPYLEMFDMGKIKQKLTKNTDTNKRRDEIHGLVPANFIAYGTPAKILDGGKVEQEFTGLLDTGYARRPFFGYSRTHETGPVLSPDELWAQRDANGSSQFLEDLSDQLGNLADIAFMGRTLQMSKPVELLFIEYELALRKIADSLGEHEEMKKAEITHRHSKTLKLAGAYAFIDGNNEITEDHAYQAIKLAEDSGKAFELILTRDGPHIKLAKFLAQIDAPVTQASLVEALPFYKVPGNQKTEMMQLSIAWGYQNNIIIKRKFEDDIEFFSGESLIETDLDKIVVSYSTDIASGYIPDVAKFSELHKMTQAKGYHWCTHYFNNRHRAEDNAIPGFNLVVLDVDKDLPLSTAKMLLAEYKAMFYTTKRHTDEENRYRIILPTNYILNLDAKEYKEFMKNLYDWLPFAVDDKTGQRSRKWLSSPGYYEYQNGKLLDVLPFIPKTSKNESFKKTFKGQQSLDNLERWVLNNSGEGNRNEMILKYALVLVDASWEYAAIQQGVLSLNNKMSDKLEESEIMQTIMVTVGRKLAERQP